MHQVLIRGPQDQFPQLAGVAGLNAEHGAGGVVGSERVLVADASDAAIAEIRALGFTVEVEESVDAQATRLAQALQDGGTDVTRIDIA